MSAASRVGPAMTRRQRAFSFFVLCLGMLPALPAGAVGGSCAIERPIAPGAKGPNRLALDAAVLAGARPVRYGGDAAEDPPIGGLEDLRLFDADGHELPYLLMLPDSARQRTVRGTLLPLPATKGASGFELDLGRIENVDRLALSGLPSPLLKRYRLECSGDRERWVRLVDEGTLFDLPAEGLSLLTADFPAGPFRYLRWTWNDATSGRVRLPEIVEARLLGRSEPPPATSVQLDVERRASEPRVSRFHLRLPGRGLPVAAIQLAVAPGDLLRRCRVSEPRLVASGIEPVVLGEAMLRQSSFAGGVAAALTVPIARPQEAGLDLTVEDGDNGALELRDAVARLRPLPWIYFDSPDGRPIVACYGRRSATAPRYDLEASRRAAASAPAASATWGAARVAAGAAPADAGLAAPPLGAALAADAFRYERALETTAAGLHQLPLDAAVLAHSHDLADLRIVTPEGRQVPYLLERRDEPLELPLVIAGAAPEDGPLPMTGARPTVSRYAIALPYSGLPAGRLAIATSSRLFDRRIALRRSVRDEGTGAERWLPVANLDWRHADPESAAPELALDLPALATARLLLEVEEGDNSPLPLTGARLLLPSWRLRFFGTGGGLRLLYGDANLAPPRYDLALLAARLVGVEGIDLALADERQRGVASQGTNGGRWFWLGLLGAIAVLLGLLARLLRSPSPS
jgi:hypothetical protein